MIVTKNLSIRFIYRFAGHHLIWLTVWMTLVAFFYRYSPLQYFKLPWLPLSIIGTAVAFYIGFKNNHAYDRLWEARKIWGAIVNNSRILAIMVKNLASLQSDANQHNVATLKRILYRNIAYTYTLREQLLQPAEWEHIAQGIMIGPFNRRRNKRIRRSFAKEDMQIQSRSYLNSEEKEQLLKVSNKAMHILDRQSGEIASLYTEGRINSMQQIELQKAINAFLEEQGKAERIKKFPFPRQYAGFGFIFTCIFVFLLPFGMVAEFSKLSQTAIWLTIPFGVIVGWIYIVMELIGDYSENPFGGLYNDIPMLSICRTIEIDLLQILGESDIPEPVVAKSEILM